MSALEKHAANRGFTLLEMAIVLAIIAVLAGILTPVVVNYVQQARITAAQADVNAIRDAICTSGCGVGPLVDQLMTNVPAYPTTANLAKPFKWKGPYISLQSDPWGNRYLVNIINAKSGSADACFVLSAGPDGRVDTPFNISETSQVAPSGDDIIARIR